MRVRSKSLSWSTVRADGKYLALDASPVVSGGPPNLAQLYRTHARLVSQWVRRLGGPDADVEDLVHEVFTVAVRKLSTFDPTRGDPGGWLHGIAVRVVSDRRKSQRLRQRLSQLFFGGPRAEEPRARDVSPETLLGLKQMGTRLERLLERLPEAQRTAFILYELEELDGPTIAAMLNTSVNNVWVRVHRARAALEAALEEESP